MADKLQKVLAAAGYGSRRELEQWISDGRVQVNGRVAKLGDRVSADDTVIVDGKRARLLGTDQRIRVLVYNKPEGEVCTRSDPEGRKTVFDRLPRLSGERWIVVGRLDINTTGLLLFTNNGELANRLMHPSYEVDREYLVRVHGQVDDAMIKRLREGVLLDDGIAKFSDVVPGERVGSNGWYTVALMEGRNREVRRLWESQGVEVNRLKRVRFGPIFMPSYVRKGQWIELDDKSLSDVLSAVDLSVRKKQRQQAPQDKKRWDRQLKRLRSRGPSSR
ncbi:23S rRNA pseudouridine(2605) synthase RluB [Porticoccus litoralis]|jgi:23S rRNA pseudouridine2605 synthase|uniref:Pseudouridine synthase n=1 Tax=Porticoccus litoralis TaxID=434086 RepID=A0AAW8B1S5_9GAMM|nr:pseudouridine synthase [Porticoccus litoralis]MDP1519746.1 pseudouridine synthase [Porticoccus litoralis]TNE93891.1 MAG: pseudouridine synthase [Gammaproteobacteria bacterium]